MKSKSKEKVRNLTTYMKKFVSLKLESNEANYSKKVFDRPLYDQMMVKISMCSKTSKTSKCI